MPSFAVRRQEKGILLLLSEQHAPFVVYSQKGGVKKSGLVEKAKRLHSGGCCCTVLGIGGKKEEDSQATLPCALYVYVFKIDTNL